MCVPIDAVHKHLSVGALVVVGGEPVVGDMVVVEGWHSKVS